MISFVNFPRISLTAAMPSIPLSRFPLGQAGAGGFPPRGEHRRSPRKRDFKPLPLKSPLRIPLAVRILDNMVAVMG
jgi:hypothetical protein